MKSYPKVTIEQWRVFQAIIEQGGYAQAATYLHRSQSAISYSISKLQKQLGISLLKLEGRKAILTEQGKVLLRRSRQLLEEASEIENFSHQLSLGREAEIRFVVDSAFPNEILMSCLAKFSRQSQGTRVKLQEVILSGATDALRNNEADLVIGIEPPAQFLSDPLITIELIAVAHPNHPLHQLNREVSAADLAQHTHVVIQDSGQYEKMSVGWLNSQDSWTVSSIESALSAIEHGLGYGWIPSNRLTSVFVDGSLKALPLEQGSKYKAILFISFGDAENIGPATKELANIISNEVENLF